MVRVYKRVCYLCDEVGECVPAIATYTSKEDPPQKYDVCAKHLQTAKEAGLPIVMFDSGDDEKVEEGVIE